MKRIYKKLTEELVLFEGLAYTAALLPRKRSGVVRLEGAIHAGPWHASADKEPVADIVTSLLDEGTKNHSREAFRFALEAAGAQLRFWAEGRYLFFSITSTSEAFPEVMKLMFETLTEPTLSEDSVREVIEREAATRLHDTENTRIQSGRAFSRLLYASHSAGYNVSPQEERHQILRLSRTDILEFFQRSYRGRIVASVVGDIDQNVLQKIFDANTQRWNTAPGESARNVLILESSDAPRESFISVPGKESVDVHMGAALRIPATDPTFPALRIAIDMLGGGFSDHLMQTIRDRDGLTYGTLARISGRDNQSGMRWSAWAMFGNSLYEKGMKALKKEMSIFLEKGITEKRLKEKIEEIEGRTAVLFSNPRHAVSQMQSDMLAVGNPADADAYMERVRGLTAKDIQQAAEKHLRIDAISAAGAVDANGELL